MAAFSCAMLWALTFDVQVTYGQLVVGQVKTREHLLRKGPPRKVSEVGDGQKRKRSGSKSPEKSKRSRTAASSDYI